MERYHIILLIVLSALGLARSQSCMADMEACQPEDGFVNFNNGQLQASSNAEYTAACQAFEDAIPCLQDVSTCSANEINALQTLIESIHEQACVDLDFEGYIGLVQCYASDLSAAEQCFRTAWSPSVTCSEVSDALSCACELWGNNCDTQAADGLRDAYTTILSFYHQNCDLSNSGFATSSWSLPGIVMVALVVKLTV